MSYDVTVDDSFNYTYNLAPFFKHFGADINSLHGLAAPDAERILTVALVRIAQTPTSELERFDADNGWGKWDTATNFLRNIRDDCRRNPDQTVEVS